MGRDARIRNKGGYWTTDAGGQTIRFGRVDEVSYEEARRLFYEYMARKPESKEPSIDELAERFLEWVLANRGKKAHSERRRHLDRFRAVFGTRSATIITSDDLEEFVSYLKYDSIYIIKHIDSVRAMYSRAIRKGWVTGYVFPGIDPILREPKALGESNLLTRQEVLALFQAARGRFGDMLRVYYATGARTAELLTAHVSDFQRTTRQLVLGKHKRSHTLRVPVPRAITLNDEAYEILEKHCTGRGPSELIFPTRQGRGFTNMTAAQEFRRVRKRAGVRDSITIYSFRHLWISEMLMEGIDTLLVARMAGTSVLMIEKVYGHFRSQSFQNAQALLDAWRAKQGGCS